MRVTGSTFLITGGASGLGEATARRFVKQGANVALLDLNEDAGNALSAELGKQAIFAKVDVTSEDSVNAAIKAALQAFGRVDGVINCAGVAPPKRVLSRSGRVHDQKHFDFIIRINVS